MALKLCAALPLPLVHMLGASLGWVLILVPNETARVTAINICHCFPELNRPERRRLIRQNLVETGKTLLESGVLWLRPGPKALRLIRQVEGDALVEEALRRGKGVILLTPHLGAWEAAGLFGATAFNMTCLYRPLRIPELEGLVHQARTRLGACYVPATTIGIRNILRRLKQGGTIAMLPDQEPRQGSGIFVPFFGSPAFTTTLPARLAARTGATIVLAWCERLRRGRGYCLHFCRAPAQSHSGDLESATLALNAAIEGLVRNRPSQYQWGYRRFRTRPQGGTSFYERRHKQSC